MSNSDARKRAGAEDAGEQEAVESRFARPLCRECGPGYRVGDPGCRHGSPDAGTGDVQAQLRDMLAVRFPSWKGYEYDEFVDRIEGIYAQHDAQVAAAAEAAAGERIAKAIEALPCPGSPPDPLAKYAYETAKAHAARIARAGRPDAAAEQGEA